jgi:hypothetical protein
MPAFEHSCEPGVQKAHDDVLEAIAATQRAARSRRVVEMVDAGLMPAELRAEEMLAKIGAGEYVIITTRRARKPWYHKKFFALIRLAFEHWRPKPVVFCGVEAQKNEDRFRYDLTIAAGFYDVVLGSDGEATLEAKSIAFDKMEQGEFEELYNTVANILLGGVLAGMTREDAEAMADEIMERRL